MNDKEPLLEMRGICKSFPGVKALDGVDFSLYPGEVLALVGENGAGKSTLMKILSGIYGPDAGVILMDGREIAFPDTNAARAAGISIIHQELNLCENLGVAANMFLGRERVLGFGYLDNRSAERKTREILAALGLNIDPGMVMNRLQPAQKQMVEIAKAVSQNARVIVMDEPTSSLTASEEKILYGLIGTLKRHGVSIIYISHKLQEIFCACDRVTVLRDGRLVGEAPVGDVDEGRLIEMMVGRPFANIYPPAPGVPESAPVVFEARGIASDGVVEASSFHVRRGEILGFAGLVGSGRTEIAKLVFGAYPVTSGEMILDGERIDRNSCGLAIRRGIAFVPEDRKLEGLSLGHSLTDNISASNYGRISRRGVLDRRSVRKLVGDGMARFRIKAPGGHTQAKALSGGNQQKVILARWLSRKPKLIILDEPTRGIDVGAKAEIYAVMRELAANDVAVIMISSDLPEVIGMSDRVAVMRGKRLVAIVERGEATQETIMAHAAGGSKSA
ncbi:MAG: sugar ABC transporter ATP-binding protein [Planctomycetota bacterium]|jgi:ribose transport system ATP-binding protein|nr:sugar ABC transporter ATP-binding protein [Planctomycetota bacterium]